MMGMSNLNTSGKMRNGATKAAARCSHKADNQFRRGCAESGNQQANKKRRYAQAESQPSAASHEAFGAEHQQDQAKKKES